MFIWDFSIVMDLSPDKLWFVSIALLYYPQDNFLIIHTICRVRKHVSIVRRHSADWICISIVRCTVQSKPPIGETIVNIITQTDMHHFYIWIVCELLTWKCFKCSFIFHLNLIKIWKFSMRNCKMHCVLVWDEMMSTHIVNID